MKNLYMIGRAMGVGKTTVSRCLQQSLNNSVFLDGDWCWDAHPFTVTEETKEMVMGNIRFMLNQFIHCSAYENIIFCWVMHEQSIINDILEGLDTQGCKVKNISLICSESVLRERIARDVKAGRRQADSVERSVAKLPYYRKLHTLKIDTDNMTPEETAHMIMQIKIMTNKNSE